MSTILYRIEQIAPVIMNFARKEIPESKASIKGES